MKAFVFTFHDENDHCSWVSRKFEVKHDEREASYAVHSQFENGQSFRMLFLERFYDLRSGISLL